MRFCLREVAYGFVPSGTATRIAGPGPTRIWSHWQEWYATSGCAKASLYPLKHGTMAVWWHSLPRLQGWSLQCHGSSQLHEWNAAHLLDLQSKYSLIWTRDKAGPDHYDTKEGWTGAKSRPACTSPQQDVGEKSRASQPCARQTWFSARDQCRRHTWLLPKRQCKTKRSCS